MPANEPPFASSPLILDVDVPTESIEELDFGLFGSTTTHATGLSPAPMLDGDFMNEDYSDLEGLGTFDTAQPKNNFTSQTHFHATRSEIRSSGSPSGSFPDSSSDSSGSKRKSSSESSRSAFTNKDTVMADAEMNDWKADSIMGSSEDGVFGDFNSTIDPSAIHGSYHFNDKAMENDFDFDNATTSPNPFSASADLRSPEMPTIKYDSAKEDASEVEGNFSLHSEANSQQIRTQSAHSIKSSGSREVSPLSTIIASHESSPGVFSGSSSNYGGVDFIGGSMLGAMAQTPTWPPNFDFPTPGQFVKGSLTTPPATNANNVSSPLSSNMLDMGGQSTLIIHTTPLKSRVETQIPIRLSLYPMPPGIIKLHLPSHTISKPKLLAKPSPQRSLDTLELSTMLVCTSAMQTPETRQKVLKRASTFPPMAPETSSASNSEELSDEAEEDKPLNGGEVKICEGCIIRERKRAARKKVKKIEEEDSWHKDERKRVVVFNTHEIKEWQPVNYQAQAEEGGDRLDPYVPETAKQIDIPMRIACYCRHQNEKVGFQVIFTIRDFNNRVIAQAVTSSIMITDDHKTHNIPPTMANTSDGLFPNSGLFATDPSFDMLGNRFRLSHSSSDLQSLQRNYSLSYQPPGIIGGPGQACTTTSSTMTPRNLSRQASPTGSIGPNTKKRKASGSSKVPSGLAMTKLETAHGVAGQNGGATIVPNAGTPSPYTPSTNFPNLQETAFNQVPTTLPTMSQTYAAGPPTPNSNDQGFFPNVNRSHSMDNLALQQIPSAPSSAHPSRAPSPNGFRNGAPVFQQQHQAQIAQHIAGGIYSMPLSLNPHRLPTIHKLIPSEGPKAGGIEVTCLGSGFCQGLEVMFGDVQATTTTYWGETSIVCLLPPATFAGTVPVTFKHQHSQQVQPYPTPIPKQQAFFKYIDDDEQQIIRTALAVLGHKMTGRMEDVRDLARRIVGEGPSAWGSSNGHSPSNGTQHQHVAGFNAATFGVDVEVTLLRCLDLIDLDDSPNMPRLNLRRTSGQTMLHLACSLGLHRFVAALLARGANPEPRDRCGFTPMHFAAMHNHPQIVRRLILSGADPTIRTLQGYTPSDLSTSADVLHATRRIEHHSRSRSHGSLRSRNSSATSLRSLWEPSIAGPPSLNHAATELDISDPSDEDDSDDHEGEYQSVDADTAADDIFWMQSRRRSTQEPVSETSDTQYNHLEMPAIAPVGGRVSPATAMIAFRDQLTAQIQHLQHTMHMNLPNLPQIPTLPMITNLPDYQAYLPTSPMVRRISSLVPHMGVSRNGSPNHSPRDSEYKWWDLFSGTLPAAPPAYDDIFPQDKATRAVYESQVSTDSTDGKTVSVLENTELSIMTSSGPSKSSLENLRIGPRITREQQDQLRLAHAEKMKKLRSDRNLFFIWIPLLLVIVAAMLYNRLPEAWTPGAARFRSTVERIVYRIAA